MMNRIGVSAAALVALLLTGWSAQASTVPFVYQGTTISCPDSGMPPCGSQLFSGDPFVGSIEVDSSAVVPGTSIGVGSILDLEFMLGDSIEFNSGNTTAVAGSINLDATGAVQGGILVFDTDAIASAPGSMLQLNFGSSIWTIQMTLEGQTETIASGSGKLTVVPVPGALLLFAPALLGFVGLRRKTIA